MDSKFLEISLSLVERPNICNKDSGQALKLLPMVQVGASPQSAKNACCFFNRLERDGASRFVSYHFIDKPELTGQYRLPDYFPHLSDATEAIRLLTGPLSRQQAAINTGDAWSVGE
jgi:hypothetical protein